MQNPFYRPVKQQLTVRMDAALVAWLRRQGRLSDQAQQNNPPSDASGYRKKRLASALRTSFFRTDALLAGWSSSRNQSDDFVSVFLADSMSDDNYGHVANQSNRPPAVFSGSVAAILFEQRKRIFSLS